MNDIINDKQKIEIFKIYYKIKRDKKLSTVKDFTRLVKLKFPDLQINLNRLNHIVKNLKV